MDHAASSGTKYTKHQPFMMIIIIVIIFIINLILGYNNMLVILDMWARNEKRKNIQGV